MHNPGQQWACAGMTTMPVRARNLITPAFAGTTNLLVPEFPDSCFRGDDGVLIRDWFTWAHFSSGAGRRSEAGGDIAHPDEGGVEVEIADLAQQCLSLFFA